MRKPRKYPSALVALWAFWSAGAALAQDLSPASPSVATAPKIPLAAVTMGGALSSGILDAAARGLESPVLRGAEIERALGIARLPDGFAPKEWEKIFEQAEADFFNGDLSDAQNRFEKISEFFKENPHAAAFYPRLRTVLFKARIHLAVIAHNAKDIELFNRHLAEAAEVEEATPSPADFPPWVCSAFASVQKSRPRTATGNLRLKSKKACVLSALGRTLGKGPLFKDLPAGETFVRVRCGDKVSPVQKIEIKENQTVDFAPLILADTVFTRKENQTVDFVPLMLKDTVFTRRGSDAVLTAPAGLEEDRVIKDLSALGAALRKDRLAAVILRPDETTVVLVDTGLARAVRRATEKGTATPKGIEDAARVVATGSREDGVSSAPTLAEKQPLLKRKWYKDWLAWTLTVSGAAVLGTGIGMLCTYDLDAEQAQVSIGLAAAGGGLLTTGGVLFFVQPLISKEQDGVSTATFGAAAGGIF